jgi:hypothetical protein
MHVRNVVLVAAASVAIAGTVMVSATASPGRHHDSDRSECPAAEAELEDARLYIEHNATDADTGVHGAFGGEGWRRLCIVDPRGRTILQVHPGGRLESLGLADLVFESREPPNDEYTIERLLSDFPEGEYQVGAVGHDGVTRSTTALFSHSIPAEPEVTAPVLAGDEDEARDAIVQRDSVTVVWSPVTETIAGEPIEITGYELIVTKVDHDDPDGLSRPIYDVNAGPHATSMPIPESFLEPATIYEVEVLALETSGNQTITLGFFTTP